jgi:hypothetical protein
MNLLQLYEYLIDELAENNPPQYWPEAQLKRYLNLGQIQLCKSTGLNEMLLPLVQAEAGAFYLPPDIIGKPQIYYKNKALDHKSATFLNAQYGGTGHIREKSGDGMTYQNNWRTEEGVPIHWYYENGKIKLYPKPETSLKLSNIRNKLRGTYSTGDSSIPLAGEIPEDQNRVDLFMNGVYQNKDQWSITNSTTITFSGWSAVVGGDYEVVYLDDLVSLEEISGSEKFIRYVSAGQTKVIVPGGYTPGIGALSVAINGVTQAASAFSEPSTGYILLSSGPVTDSIIEITVTRPDPTSTAAASYIQKPVDMVNDLDLPFVKNEYWQEAIVHYAAFLALTKEGKMTQDISKGQIHANKYQSIVDEIRSVIQPEIDFSPFVDMPFHV